MNTLPHAVHDIINTVDHAETNATIVSQNKSEMYAAAAHRMQRGRRLVFSGFTVAIIGIVAYCIICFSSALNVELGTALLNGPAWLTGPALGIIGLGTLLWLIGSFAYLRGAMDSDPDGTSNDLNF